MPPPFSKITGYHTCAADLASRVAAGQDHLRPGSKNPEEQNDWLGTGVYFWVGNFLMARWWINKITEIDPSFRGAILKYEIELGRCLDLSDAKYLLRLSRHEQSIPWASMGGRPVNEIAPPGHRLSGEYNKRFLDHAVIDDYCTNVEQNIETVYGLFRCGPPIYSGSGLYSYNHAQLAVRENGLHLIRFIDTDIE